MNEVWKDLFGFENTYEVSSNGYVRSKTRIVRANKSGGIKIVQSKQIAIFINKKRGGYNYIKVKHKALSLHRITWISHNGLIPKKLEINHINGNKSNNKLSNLEIVTSSENKIHAYKTGLKKAIKFSKNTNSKKIISIDYLGVSTKYGSISEAVYINKYFSKQGIIGCLKGRIKKHKQHIFKYDTE